MFSFDTWILFLTLCLILFLWASIKYFLGRDKPKVSPGDLIEINRSILFPDRYRHWAVYVGDGDVVHFASSGWRFGTSLFFGSKAGIVKQKLQDVVGKDKWKVNNLLDHKYPPRSADDIVRHAYKMVDAKLEYNAGIYNCEHFSTHMRYGKPESRQAKTATGITAGAGLFFAAVGGIGGIGIITAAGLYVSAIAGVTAGAGVLLKAIVRRQA